MTSRRGVSDPAVERARHNALARVLEAHQADRVRLSRFLHDEIAQFLSGIGLQLDILRMDYENVTPEIAVRTKEIQAVLEQLVQRVRDFSYGLDPEVVERAGLISALDRLVGHYRRLFKGSVRLLASPGRISFPPGAARAAYRIADLAIDNAVLHSGAGQIEISLRTRRGWAEIEVRDDGSGFDPGHADALSPGLGLPMMRHVAECAGLDLKIRASAGAGSSVIARIKPTVEEGRA